MTTLHVETLQTPVSNIVQHGQLGYDSDQRTFSRGDTILLRSPNDWGVFKVLRVGTEILRLLPLLWSI